MPEIFRGHEHTYFTTIDPAFLEALDEIIEKSVREHPISRGEAWMGFWANYAEGVKGQTNEDKKKMAKGGLDMQLIMFYCLEKVLGLNTNDPVFFKRPGGRPELVRVYDSAYDFEEAKAELKKAQVELHKAEIKHYNAKTERIRFENYHIGQVYNVIQNWMVLHCAKPYTTDPPLPLEIGMRVLILPIWEYDNTHKIKLMPTLARSSLQKVGRDVVRCVLPFDFPITTTFDPEPNDLLCPACGYLAENQDGFVSHLDRKTHFEASIKQYQTYHKVSAITAIGEIHEEERNDVVLQDKDLHELLYHLEGKEEFPVLYEGKIKNFIQWNQIDKIIPASFHNEVRNLGALVEISSTEEAYDSKIGYVKAVWGIQEIPVINQETGKVSTESVEEWDTVMDYWHSLPNHIFEQSGLHFGEGFRSRSFSDIYTFDAELDRYINKDDN